MSDKIKCGGGEHCQYCKFYESLGKNDTGFSKNQMGRCDWYADKAGSSRHVLKQVR